MDIFGLLAEHQSQVIAVPIPLQTSLKGKGRLWDEGESSAGGQCRAAEAGATRGMRVRAVHSSAGCVAWCVPLHTYIAKPPTSLFLQTMNTVQPRRASAVDAAYPMPELAPVIMTTWPLWSLSKMLRIQECDAGRHGWCLCKQENELGLIWFGNVVLTLPGQRGSLDPRHWRA